ncbi:MAG: phage holin family protein [Thermodesulfobacteriota bacterium]
MRVYLIRWCITTLGIMVVPYVVSGVRVEGLGSAVLAAAVLGVLNVVLWPVLVILTLPLTLLTFGLFLLVINGLLFALAGAVVPGITVASFWSAFAGGVIVSIVSWTANRLLALEGDSTTTIVVRRYESRDSDGKTIDMRRDKTGKWE